MNKEKRLFYFATEREARATRSLLGAHELIAPGLYHCPQGYVRIGGMGILAAASSAACDRFHWGEMWNFGIAATLSAAYPLETRVVVGSVLRPSFFPDGLETRSQEWYHRLFPTLHLTEERSAKGTSLARLVSCDFPIHQSHLADCLRSTADLLDMEGYGLAFTARQNSKPCFIGKWITDCATAEGPTAIERLLDHASQQFAEWVSELLRDPPESFLPH